VGLFFSLAAFAVWGLVLFVASRALARTPRVEPATPPGPEETPLVTVYVPARNEARVIAPCVNALAQQGAIIDRIVVIDDRSNDGTRSRLEELKEQLPRIVVIEGSGPEAGECGKPAALRDGNVRSPSEREWLLFVDADVILRPGAVRGLVALAREKGADLLTVFPELELGGPAEKLVMPSIAALIAARYPADKVADSRSPIAFANGQVILIRRGMYEAAGGHGAVVNEILEDVRLAERVKAKGGQLCLADGRQIARTRMYESWSEIVRGWSKNLFLLFGSKPGPTIIWAIGSIFVASLGLLALVTAGWPLGVAAYLFVLGVQALIRKRGGAPAGWAVFAPIAAIATAWIMIVSMRLHLGGKGVSWKGRRIATGSRGAS
jgi:chlorobactene glucosyltransferase